MKIFGELLFLYQDTKFDKVFLLYETNITADSAPLRIYIYGTGRLGNVASEPYLVAN